MAESAAPTGPFQYILCAATSPAVKQQDESLTYLNQGKPLSSRTNLSQRRGAGTGAFPHPHLVLLGLTSATAFNSIKIGIKQQQH